MIDILPWDQSNKETLETRIMRQEGFCAIPKYDAKGMWVIGFGCDITKDECAQYQHGISWDDAEKLLEYRLNIIKQQADKQFSWLDSLDPLRKDVIYDMCYQMGVAGVAQFHGMIAAILAGDWQSASNHMLGSLWHTETPARCEELSNLMLKGNVVDISEQ